MLIPGGFKHILQKTWTHYSPLFSADIELCVVFRDILNGRHKIQGFKQNDYTNSNGIIDWF